MIRVSFVTSLVLSTVFIGPIKNINKWRNKQRTHCGIVRVFYVPVRVQTDLHCNRWPCKCSFTDNRKTHRCPVHVHREKNMHSCLHCVSVYHTVSIFKSFEALIFNFYLIFHVFPISNKSYHTTSKRGERICLIWVDISEPSKHFSTIPITQDGQLCIHSAIRRVSVNKNSVVITQLSASVPDQMK